MRSQVQLLSARRLTSIHSLGKDPPCRTYLRTLSAPSGKWSEITKLALKSLGFVPGPCPCDSCLAGRRAAERRAEFPQDPSPTPPKKQPPELAGRGKPKRPSTRRARSIRAQDKVCRYCLIAPAESVDHIVPLSRGGSNANRNLVGCCIACNQNKGDRLPREAGMLLRVPLRLVPSRRL